MDDADRLNAVLRREHPATERMLSPLGRRLAFPRGIPFQADEARGSRIDATIGQLTDGEGSPIPLPALLASVDGLDPAATFLYAPIDGPRPLREAWGARERRLAGGPAFATSLPFLSHGLTHSLSIVSSLFADPDTDIIVPAPAWENYDLIFEMYAGARIVRYAVTTEGRFDISGLARALAQIRTKGIVVLNFPSNPAGWMPTAADVAQIVEVLTQHPGPLVVVTDDAYQDWVYESDRHPRSLFWDIAAKADPERLLVLKSDGATKELVFFASRVGFLTHTVTGTGETALLSKLKTVVRGTVGCASGPAMAMVQRALLDPNLEHDIAERRALLADRYQVLKSALGSLDPSKVTIHPFNSAFFVFLELVPGIDAEAVRQRLLRESSVGAIAFRAENAIRLAYCSIHRDRLPDLVDALVHAIGEV